MNKMERIKICKGYKKSKHDSICMNCNSNKSYCEYTRSNKIIYAKNHEDAKNRANLYKP